MSTSLVAKSRETWNNAIALYIMGPKPYYHYFKAYISRVRKPRGDLKKISNDNGFYVIKFDNADDCDKVLSSGSYFYNKKLIVMKKQSSRNEINQRIPSNQSYIGSVFGIRIGLPNR